MMPWKKIFGSCLAALMLGACALQGDRLAVKPSALTPGMAKKFIYPGKTTQADVIEIFGPPNLVTRQNNRDVWTYDRISQEVSASGGFLTIFLAGYERGHASSSTRSIMLIIYFTPRDVVQDFTLSAAQF